MSDIIFEQNFWNNLELNYTNKSCFTLNNYYKKLNIYLVKLTSEIIPYTNIEDIDAKISYLNLNNISDVNTFKNIMNLYFNKKIYDDEKQNLKNLYLYNDTVTYKFMVDKETLFSNTSDNILYQKVPNLKLDIKPHEIIFKELKDFNTDLAFPDYLEPIDNNIYKLKLHLFKSKKYKCIFEINFDSKFYPLLPPKIDIISPTVDYQTLVDIVNCKIFSTNWNPIINFKWLFLSLKESLLKYETEYHVNIFASKNDLFNKDNKIIFNFANELKVLETLHPINIEFDHIEVKKNKSYWEKGIGYGHDGLNTWSLEEYLKNKENINKKIINYLSQILEMDLLSDNIDFVSKIILKEIKGITILDLEKNNKLYDLYFKILNKFLTDIYLEKELFNDLKSLVGNLEIGNFEEFSNIKKDIETILSNNKQSYQEETKNDDYCSQMKELQFKYYDISNTKYNSNFSDTKPTPIQTLRLAKDINSLQNSLPLNEESTVWIRWNKESLNKMQFLISGPKDTPYQDGLFLFDCFFPKDYPSNPPHVILKTTGNGKVRFNPNLYNCGKVCLSLLGTWQGHQSEKWNKKTSTLLQVIVSIQSLILVEEPFFNEPSYERLIGTTTGKNESSKYNKNIRINTCRYAIKNMIENPPYGFEEVVEKHFEMKKNSLLKTIKMWSDDKKFKNEYQEIIEFIDKN